MRQAVTKRALGNRWRTQARTQPSTLLCAATGIHSKKKILETRRKKRRLALDKLLGTEAKWRHIQEKSEAEARNVQYPISAIRGQSLPEFAEAIGNHGRILKKRAGTYEDQHIDMVIIFMSSSTKATIHLGQNFIENMTVCKNIDVEEIQDLFSITQRLVWDHSEEIQNVKVIESTDCSWTRTKLSHRQVIKRTKGKSPCILRLCTMSGKLSSEATQRWKGKLTDFFSQQLLIKNYLALMENQLSSSVTLSENVHHCRFF